MKHTVNISHTRNKKIVYKKIVRDNICPFCVDFSKKKNVFHYHSKPALFHGTHWVVTENFDPYDGAKHHFMFVHRKHISLFSEIKPVALQELILLTKKLEKRFLLPAGIFLFRSGDTRYTGGSVTHFHGHFILGDKKTKGTNDPLVLFAGYKYNKYKKAGK